jgi:hypothetical protein
MPLVLALFFALGKPLEAGDYRVRKNAEGLAFEIAINRNPPVLGDNEIRIEIKDPQGNPVLDAEVLVTFRTSPSAGLQSNHGLSEYKNCVLLMTPSRLRPAQIDIDRVFFYSFR